MYEEYNNLIHEIKEELSFLPEAYVNHIRIRVEPDDALSVRITLSYRYALFSKAFLLPYNILDDKANARRLVKHFRYDLLHYLKFEFYDLLRELVDIQMYLDNRIKDYIEIPSDIDDRTTKLRELTGMGKKVCYDALCKNEYSIDKALKYMITQNFKGES